MNRDLVKDYLGKSGMNDAQAEALSRILDQMATKNELQLLREEMEVRFMALERKIETVKGDLTWRLIALFAFFGTIMTLLDVFVD